MQILLRLAAIVVMLVSTNALFMLGYKGYFASGGSAIEKLHPVFYILLAAVPLYLMTSRRRLGDLKLKGMLWPSIWMLAAASAFTLWTVISPNAGGEISVPAVTFLTPALLLLLLNKATDKTLLFITGFVSLFFVVNSLVGLLGYFTGINFITQTAGNMVVRDPRPTGLLGHPLVNSQMTGIWLMSILMIGVRDGFKVRSLTEAALHALALVAFGGRSALALLAICLFLYLTYRSYRAVITGKHGSLVSLLVLLVLGAMAVPLAIEAGVADVLFERLSDDGGSADTRLAALQMLSILDFGQWLIGAGPAMRNAMLVQLNTPNGIESFPLAIIVNYGLPAMLLITVTTFGAFFRLARPMGGIGNWVVVYFLVTSAASLSLGSKTTTASIFLLVLLALRTKSLMAPTVVRKKPSVSIPNALIPAEVRR